MEVDEGVDIEEGGDASLHDGDAISHPRSQAEELDDGTGHSTASNAGESRVEGRNTPRRHTRDVTPRPQSRSREEEGDDPWSITQSKWDHGINLNVTTPWVNEPEEQREYEERKNLFMKLAPDMVECAKRAGKAAREAGDAAMKTSDTATQVASDARKAAECAKRAGKEVEEAAEKLSQLFNYMKLLEPVLGPKTDRLDTGHPERNTRNSPPYDPSYF
jgi:hypothetical protein